MNQINRFAAHGEIHNRFALTTAGKKVIVFQYGALEITGTLKRVTRNYIVLTTGFRYDRDRIGNIWNFYSKSRCQLSY